jgi:hypothetical protein
MNDKTEDKDYVKKVDAFISIYQLLKGILQVTTDIAKTGYINPLSKACETKVENLEFHFWTNFDFDIYIVDSEFDENCVDRFEDFYELGKDIKEEVKNVSLTILNSKEDYYLNYLSGAQYNTLLDYLTKNKVGTSSHQKEFAVEEAKSLLEYCFGKESKKVVVNELMKSTIYVERSST